MKVAIFGKVFSPENKDYIQLLINKLEQNEVSLTFYEPFYRKIKDLINIKSDISFFNGNDGLKNRVDRMAPYNTSPMKIKITRNIVSGEARGSDGQPLIASTENRSVIIDFHLAKTGKTRR